MEENVLDDNVTSLDLTQQTKDELRDYYPFKNTKKDSNGSFLRDIMIFLYNLEVFISNLCVHHKRFGEILFAFFPIIYVLLNSLLFFTLSDKISFLVFSGFLVLFLIFIVLRGFLYLLRRSFILGFILHFKPALTCILFIFYIIYFLPEKSFIITTVAYFTSLLIFALILFLQLSISVSFKHKKIVNWSLIILISCSFIFLFLLINNFLGTFIYLLSTIIGMILYYLDLQSKETYYFISDAIYFWIANVLYNLVSNITIPNYIVKIESRTFNTHNSTYCG